MLGFCMQRVRLILVKIVVQTLETYQMELFCLSNLPRVIPSQMRPTFANLKSAIGKSSSHLSCCSQEFNKKETNAYKTKFRKDNPRGYSCFFGIRARQLDCPRSTPRRQYVQLPRYEPAAD